MKYKLNNSQKTIIESILVVFILLFISIFSNITVANNSNNQYQYLNINYEFKNPKIEKIQIKNEIYDRISLPDTINIGKPNEPCLPIKGAYILIPQNTEINNIRVERKNPVFLQTQLHMQQMEIRMIRSPLRSTNRSQNERLQIHNLCSR